MPQTTTSPNLAPTSPTSQGATSNSDLAQRPPPYGGEVTEKPKSHPHHNTTQTAHLGEVMGEVTNPPTRPLIGAFGHKDSGS